MAVYPNSRRISNSLVNEPPCSIVHIVLHSRSPFSKSLNPMLLSKTFDTPGVYLQHSIAPGSKKLDLRVVSPYPTRVYILRWYYNGRNFVLCPFGKRKITSQ